MHQRVKFIIFGHETIVKTILSRTYLGLISDLSRTYLGLISDLKDSES